MTSPHWIATPSGRLRARGLGLPLDGTPGPFNAITDVAGVAVGYTTLISGEGPLRRGHGPVRTGVTAILPRGRAGAGTACFAGLASFNGNGELTGSHWIEEAGELQSPIGLTNTASCGTVRDAIHRWQVEAGIGTGQDWGLPVAGETYDGRLNDTDGFHVRPEHVFAALDGAAGGPLDMGSLGGGTGMMTYEFKGGSASASRLVATLAGTFTLGSFVQSNFGRRHELTILGVPVGRHLPEGTYLSRGTGSIIAVVATDAPLLPHQLKRLARRVPLGLARTGTIGHNSSGDIFIAFSTANGEAMADAGQARTLSALPDAGLDPLFEAVVETVEEAIVDALVANATMTGRDGNTLEALPHDRLLELMRRYGRL